MMASVVREISNEPLSVRNVVTTIEDEAQFERFRTGEDFSNGVAYIADAEYSPQYHRMVTALQTLVDSVSGQRHSSPRRALPQSARGKTDVTGEVEVVVLMVGLPSYCEPAVNCGLTFSFFSTEIFFSFVELSFVCPSN